MIRPGFIAFQSCPTLGSYAEHQPSGSMAVGGLFMLTCPLLQDLESSEKLAEQINALFPEERLYR